ncbi:MAG: alpha/beta hydrolase [Caulobacteraceae bacterium]
MSRRGAATLVAFGALALAALGAVAFTAPGDDPAAHPGRLVRLPDGRRLNLRCSGAGSPTVILEGGFAATSMGWYKVQPLIARHRRVCSYDRAGYGFSDPGPLPRDGAAVARDLDDALRAAGIGGPFVLVGHSAGGLYVRLFADRRPGEVVGMVLVDPSVEHQDERLAERFGPGAGSLAPQRARAVRCLDAAVRDALPSVDPALVVCAPPPRASQSAAAAAAELAQARRPSTWETQISELDTLWGATSREIDAGRQNYGAMPLVVLTAAGTLDGAPEPARAAALEVWAGLHRQIAARSTRGSARTIERSTHMMIFDRPDAIAEAVEEVASVRPRQ